MLPDKALITTDHISIVMFKVTVDRKKRYIENVAQFPYVKIQLNRLFSRALIHVLDPSKYSKSLKLRNDKSLITKCISLSLHLWLSHLLHHRLLLLLPSLLQMFQHPSWVPPEVSLFLLQPLVLQQDNVVETEGEWVEGVLHNYDPVMKLSKYFNTYNKTFWEKL